MSDLPQAINSEPLQSHQQSYPGYEMPVYDHDQREKHHETEIPFATAAQRNREGNVPKAFVIGRKALLVTLCIIVILVAVGVGGGVGGSIAVQRSKYEISSPH